MGGKTYLRRVAEPLAAGTALVSPVRRARAEEPRSSLGVPAADPGVARAVGPRSLPARSPSASDHALALVPEAELPAPNVATTLHSTRAGLREALPAPHPIEARSPASPFAPDPIESPPGPLAAAPSHFERSPAIVVSPTVAPAKASVDAAAAPQAREAAPAPSRLDAPAGNDVPNVSASPAEIGPEPRRTPGEAGDASAPEPPRAHTRTSATPESPGRPARLELPPEAARAPSGFTMSAHRSSAAAPGPRVHIGTIEVRSSRPAPPIVPAPRPVPVTAPSPPARAAPLARGLSWRYGLVQS